MEGEETGVEERAGLRARLKANLCRPTILSLFVANAWSIINKMEEVRAQTLPYCVMIITEAWLNGNIPDAADEQAGSSVLRADQRGDSGKSRGGRNNSCGGQTLLH